MEKRNNKRKTMLIAAFAVAVIALAGIGYATASNFMAKTVNSENTANTVFITATQSDYTGAFSPASELEFNTYTDDDNNPDGTGALYTLTDGNTTIGGYHGKKINAASLTITIALTGSVTGQNVTGYNIAVKTGALAGAAVSGYNSGDPTGWVYIMAFGGTSNLIYSFEGGTTWTDDEGSAVDGVEITGTSTTVDLYIAAKKTFNQFSTIYTPVADDGYYGCGTSTVAPAAALYDDINVTFTVTAELTAAP